MIKLVDTAVPMNEGGYPVARAKDIWFEDNTTLQDMSENGSMSGVELLQSEYDSLTDEEKLNGLKYHCTDTGRIYQNGVLYGEKKPIELTYEKYKQLETDGLVEPDVDYIIIGNESGVLLTSTDVAYSDTLTVKGKFDEVDEAIDELDTPIGKTFNVADAENNLDNIVGLMEDKTTCTCIANSSEVSGTPKDTFSTETGFFEVTTTRVNSTYAWQTAKKMAEKSNIFQRCLLNGTWSDWNSIGSIRNEVTNDVNTWSSKKIASELGRIKLNPVGTSNGWNAIQDMSSYSVGIYKLNVMHSATGGTIETLILKTGYSYIIKNMFKEGNISVSVSGDTITVAEVASSIGVIVASINLIGEK